MRAGWMDEVCIHVAQGSFPLLVLLETGYLNMMEKSSPGDGFLRPKKFHRKWQWKKATAAQA